MSEEKQIEKMLKCICMGCRNFMRCNDDTMYGSKKLSEVMREECSIYKLGEALYNAVYREQTEVAKEIFAEIHRKLDNEIARYKKLSQNTINLIATMTYGTSKATLINVRHYIAELQKKYTGVPDVCDGMQRKEDEKNG